MALAITDLLRPSLKKRGSQSPLPFGRGRGAGVRGNPSPPVPPKVGAERVLPLRPSGSSVLVGVNTQSAGPSPDVPLPRDQDDINRQVSDLMPVSRYERQQAGTVSAYFVMNLSAYLVCLSLVCLIIE